MPNKATTLGIPRADIAGALLLAPTESPILHTEVFAPFEVKNRSGELGFIDAAAGIPRSETGTRANNAKYPRLHWTFKGKTYSCADYGFEESIDDNQIAEYADTVNLENFAGRRCRDHALVQAEADFVASIMNTTTFALSGNTGVDSSSTPWSNASTGDPVADSSLAIAGIQARSGMKPNCVVMTDKNWRYAWRTAAVRNTRPLYTTTTEIPDVNDLAARKALASVLQVRDVFVSDFFYNSANEGATPSLSRVVSDTYVFFCKRALNPLDIMEPCIGRTFY